MTTQNGTSNPPIVYNPLNCTILMYNNIVYKYYTTIMYNFNGYIYTLLKNYRSHRSHRSQYIKKAFIYAGCSRLRSDYDKFSIVVKRSQHSHTIPVNI